jgi:DNA-directed RNA polymerase specialized sigma24 family protein
MIDPRESWTPKQTAFRAFLSWLDEGTDSGGGKYLEVRRRLVLYFDRKNCSSPDDLADETLSRVARKLEEQGAITNVTPLHYCYIVAKFVFLESLRSGKRIDAISKNAAQTGVPGIVEVSSAGPGAGLDNQQQRFACLERCLSKLRAEDRDLIVEYYRGQQRSKIEGRSRLAARLGLTANALTIRACRIRGKLEACVRGCLEGE